MNDPALMTGHQLQFFHDQNAFYSYSPSIIDIEQFRLGPIVRKTGVAIAVNSNKTADFKHNEKRYQAVVHFELGSSKKYLHGKDEVLEGSIHKPLREKTAKQRKLEPIKEEEQPNMDTRNIGLSIRNMQEAIRLILLSFIDKLKRYYF